MLSEDSVTGFGDDVPIEEQIRIQNLIRLAATMGEPPGAAGGRPPLPAPGPGQARPMMPGMPEWMPLSFVAVHEETGYVRHELSLQHGIACYMQSLRQEYASLICPRCAMPFRLLELYSQATRGPERILMEEIQLRIGQNHKHFWFELGVTQEKHTHCPPASSHPLTWLPATAGQLYEERPMAGAGKGEGGQRSGYGPMPVEGKGAAAFVPYGAPPLSQQAAQRPYF